MEQRSSRREGCAWRVRTVTLMACAALGVAAGSAVAQTPVNDEFGAATDANILGIGNVTGSTVGATWNPATDVLTTENAHTVWYTWTASTTARVGISQCTGPRNGIPAFGSTLVVAEWNVTLTPPWDVLAGTTVGAGGCPDPGASGLRRWPFDAVAGHTYYFQVGGGEGDFELSLDTLPEEDGVPTISGTGAVGSPLQGPPADLWLSSTDYRVTYLWYLCNVAEPLLSCAPIGGATGNTYVPPPAYLGKTVRVRTFGTNYVGTVAGSLSNEIPIIGNPNGDFDGDGVLDGVDQCPELAGVAPSGCPTPQPTPAPQPSPSPTPFPAVPTVTAPKVAAPKAIRAAITVVKGSVTTKAIVIACPVTSTGPCAGTVTVTIKVGTKRVVLGSRRVSVVPGGKLVPKVKLTRAALARLAAKRRLKASIGVAMNAPKSAIVRTATAVTLAG